MSHPFKKPRLSALFLSTLFFGFSTIYGITLEKTPGSFELVKDGVAQSVIVLEKDAAPSVRRAAEELQTYFRKVSGAEIPIQNEPSPETFSIFLATSPVSASLIEQFGITQKVSALSKDGFVLKANEQGLLIASKKPLGVLYGAYTFLEDVLGVRWLMPGEDGEFVPSKKSIAIGSMEDIQNPAFPLRSLVLTCVKINVPTWDTWDWMVRNKMNIAASYPPLWKEKETAERIEALGVIHKAGGHVLASFVPNSLFETHPEYFALVNGERRQGGHSVDETGKVYQRCTSNPAVIDLSVDYVKTKFSEGMDSFLIGNNDGNGWCECDACRALDDPTEAADGGRVTTRFFKFINEVADRVLKDFPDKEIDAWAYQQFRLPPLGVKPDPRLHIAVAMHGRCYRHSIDDPNCPVNVKLCEALADWQKFASTIGLREYYSAFIGGESVASYYVPLEDIVARDIKYAARTGLKLWKDETPPVDGSFAERYDTKGTRQSWRARYPMYYVAAKLLWNPDLDVEKLKDEAYAGYYGPAAEAMKSYRKLLIQAWEQTPGHFIYGANSNAIGKSLAKPGLEKQLLEFLAAAEQAAANDPKFQSRIALEKELFAEVWQEAARNLEKSTAFNEVNVLECPKGKESSNGMPAQDAWDAAVTVSGFSRQDGKSAETQTFVQMLYDDTSVYFRLTMLEPTPALITTRLSEPDSNIWSDNSVEVFLDPKKSGDQFYHLAINAKGILYDAIGIGGGSEDKAWQSEAKVEAKVLEDRWVVDLKIPLSSLKTQITKGDSWMVNVARSRRLGEKTRIEHSSWTDGGFGQTNSFRPIVFGAEPSLLHNGGFESVREISSSEAKEKFLPSGWISENDPSLIAERWALHEGHPGVLTIVSEETHSGKHALKVERGWIHQGFFVKEGDTLRISFWAKGSGSVQVMLFHYEAEPDGKTLRVAPTAELEKISLVEEWEKHEMEFTISELGINRVALAFAASEVLFLDDVAVEKVKNN